VSQLFHDTSHNLMAVGAVVERKAYRKTADTARLASFR
jgi:hypothetical protein